MHREQHLPAPFALRDITTDREGEEGPALGVVGEDVEVVPLPPGRALVGSDCGRGVMEAIDLVSEFSEGRALPPAVALVVLPRAGNDGRSDVGWRLDYNATATRCKRNSGVTATA